MNANETPTSAQQAALAQLEAEHGPASYVNTRRPQHAIWADFLRDERDYMYRIAPDGVAEDCTEALVNP